MKFIIALFILSGCTTSPMSPIHIKTWILNKDELKHRTIMGSETKPFSEAQGSRCYSMEDDTIWRSRMASCCGQAGL